MKQISTPQWKWASTWAVVVVTLTALPVLWGWLNTPPGGEFVGYLFNASDTNTYFSKMQLGRDGGWLFHLTFTGETGGEGAVIFLPYLLLGKLAGLLGLPNALMFHMARLVFGFGLLLASYYLICRLFNESNARRLAFLLVCFSSGFGWLLYPLGMPQPLDFWVAEALTFTTIFANPHFPLATMLLILIMAWCLDAIEGRRERYFWAAVASFVLGFVHPYLLITLAVVLGVYWLRLTIIAGWPRIDWLSFGALIGVGVAGMPGPLLTVIGINSDPQLRDWMGQNQTLSFLWLNTLSIYGFVTILAAVGGWLVEVSGWRKRQEPALLKRWWLISTWAVATLVLQYVPLSFQRRFLEGWHLPLVCLATLTLYEVIWPWLKTRLKMRRASFVVLTVFLTGLTTVLFLIAQTSLVKLSPLGPEDISRTLYLNAEEVAAYKWLDANTQPTDVVMTGLIAGNWLPPRVHARPFWGHNYETVDSDKKYLLMQSFFQTMPDYSNPTSDKNFQTQLIKQYNLSYLLYTQRERDLGQFDPAKMSWTKVFEQGNVQIYKLPR